MSAEHTIAQMMPSHRSKPGGNVEKSDKKFYDRSNLKLLGAVTYELNAIQELVRYLFAWNVHRGRVSSRRHRYPMFRMPYSNLHPH